MNKAKACSSHDHWPDVLLLCAELLFECAIWASRATIRWPILRRGYGLGRSSFPTRYSRALTMNTEAVDSLSGPGRICRLAIGAMPVCAIGVHQPAVNCNKCRRPLRHRSC